MSRMPFVPPKPAPEPSEALKEMVREFGRFAMQSDVTDEMVEDGCRGMYGKHWDGPPEKMPGEQMKDVWRKLARKCLDAALAMRQGQ